MTFSFCKRKVYFLISGNLGALNFGIYFGWSAVANPKLQSKTTPELDTPLTDEDISYSTAFPFIIGALSAVLWSYIASTLGRKVTGYLTALCFIVCYGLILNTKSTILLIVSRIIGGLSYIPVLFNGPMYIAEIAEPHKFGRLSSFVLVSQNFGALMIFSMADYVSFKFLNIFAMVCGIIFFVSLLAFPESPVHYLKTDKQQEARIALQFFRPKDNPSLLESELKRLNQTFVLSKKMKLKYLISRHTLMGLVIAAYMQFALQFTGINYIASYTVDILQRTNSTISPYTSIKISGVVNTFAPWIYFSFTNSFGRKRIAMASYALLSLIHGSFGWYFFYTEHNVLDKSSLINYLPVVIISLFFLTFSAGAGCINFTLYGEIFSSEVRNFVIPMIYVWSGMLSFLVVKLAPTLMLQTIHLSGVFWVFSACCFLTFIFTALVIPETKDKPFLTVIEELTKKSCW